MKKESFNVPKADKNSFHFQKESLDILWRMEPKFCKYFMPFRWQMPQGTYSPEYYLLHAYTQTKLVEKNVSDRCALAWTLNINGYKKYGFRTYALDRDLGNDLLQTEAEGFDMTNLRLPLPTFMICLPEKLLNTGLDGNCMFILVSVNMKENRFAVCSGLESGAAYTFFSPCDSNEIKKLLGEDKVFYQSSTAPKGYEEMFMESNDDSHHLRKITYLTLNILAYLSTPQPDIFENPEVRVAKKRRKASFASRERDIYHPWIIGEQYRRGVKTGNSPGRTRGHGSVRVHWRAGHWRRQRYGKGRIQTKLIHIAPSFVGASKDN